MEKTDEILLILGEVRGDVKSLLLEDRALGKRIKSLETTRTRQYAIFGVIGSVCGWFAGLFK